MWLGYQNSYLGYPTTGEFAIPGRRRNSFQRGFITYTFSTNRTFDRPY